MKTIPFHYRGGVGFELVKMYGDDKKAFAREIVVNVFDQSHHEDVKGKRAQAVIKIYRQVKIIEIEDWLTGINTKELEEFIAFGAADATGNTGKRVGDLISSYNNMNDDIVGQKHLGKMSCLAASLINSVEFWSNNGRIGYYFHMVGYNEWEAFSYPGGSDLPYKTMDKNEALEHRGLKVKILEADDESMNVNGLIEYIQKYLGMLLKRDKLFVDIIEMDNQKITHVRPPDSLDTRGEKTVGDTRIFKDDGDLVMSKGGNIKINVNSIDSITRNNLDVYNKEVYVTSIRVPYLVDGYVIYNGFQLGIARENYGQNKEFFTKLNEYLRRHYQPEPEMKPNKMSKDQNKVIKTLVSNAFKSISELYPGLLPPNLFGISKIGGIPGTRINSPNVGNSVKYDLLHNMKYTDTGNPNGRPVIHAGPGPLGPGPGRIHTGTGTGRGIEPGGKYTVKIQKQLERDEQETQGEIMPDFVVNEYPNGEFATVTLKLVPGRPPEIIINSLKPAAKALKDKSPVKIKDTLLDKIVRALLQVSCTKSSMRIFEYDNMVDAVWNDAYTRSID